VGNRKKRLEDVAYLSTTEYIGAVLVSGEHWGSSFHFTFDINAVLLPGGKLGSSFLFTLGISAVLASGEQEDSSFFSPSKLVRLFFRGELWVVHFSHPRN